ncbi:hypothetical protein B9Z55_025397 [Caenorhabditis nigoni]|uniref:Uncharacterized protein n=1 Tax=Caenorhabditis nigoni TaxID=1611254 RepID=A0A2G5SZ09_9PELO|nr:hypothetical protein B9Z55_025397 [Caenorhabditis nigoni]
MEKNEERSEPQFRECFIHKCQNAEKFKSYTDAKYTNCLAEKIGQEKKCSRDDVKKLMLISKFMEKLCELIITKDSETQWTRN